MSLDRLDSLSAEVLARLFRVAWQAGALVVVIAAAERLLGRRLGARWRYALWLLVVARLVLPELPRVPFGVLPLEPVAARDGRPSELLRARGRRERRDKPLADGRVEQIEHVAASHHTI